MRHSLAARRRALGLSQSDLAERVGVDRSTVARCEQGISTPRPWYRPLWADALDVSLAELDALLGEAQEEDVDRRDFLQGAIAAAATFATPGSASWVPAEADLGSIRAAVARATRLERATQYAALDVMLPGLLSEVNELASGGRVHAQEATGLLSQAEALHAWLLIKQDRPDAAERAATAALAAGDKAGDVCVAGAAMRCLGEVQMRAGRFAVASDLSIEAAEIVRRARLSTGDALAVIGAGYLSAAMAFARAGDAASAGELLDAAAASAADLDHDVSTPAAFGPSNVAIHRVAIPTELGDPIAALDQARRTPVDMASGHEERSGRYLIDIARAYTARRQDAPALRALLQAEQLAAEEVRMHRLTHSVLITLLGRERRSRTPALRPMAARCGVLERA